MQYLGENTTDEYGKTIWKMTSENHTCKTYYEGKWYFTGNFTVSDITNTSIDIETTQLEVHAIAGNPLTSQSVHLYIDPTGYIGEETTNEYGIAYYDVAENSYKAKTYYQGLWWWSPVISFPTQTQAIINISITDVAVYVYANNQSLENQNVHCYRTPLTYIGYDATDATGKSDWELSDGSYQCKTQYNSVWYWTYGNFTVPNTTNVSIVI